ncbi:unnamed protein product, partial [Oppiella nova]
TIRVLCSFETSDQTVTLMSTNPNVGKSPGIDVTSLQNARTRLEQPITSVVTNTAPPPSVMMRILDRTGNDAQIVGLGDELVLRIELKDPSSAFAVFARNLYARSSNGESLFLIDNTGCPTDPAIFPALQVDQRDKRSLFSTFKAFRFPTTGVVNFEVQIRFCQEKCEPVKCVSGSESFGRRRKRNTNEDNDEDSDAEEYINETETLRQNDSLQPILIPNDEAILAIRKRVKGIRVNKTENKNLVFRNRSALMEDSSNSSVTSEPLPQPQPQQQQQTLPLKPNPSPAQSLPDTKPVVGSSQSTESSVKVTVPSFPQSYGSNDVKNNGNKIYESYGYNNPSLSGQQQPPSYPPAQPYPPAQSYPPSQSYLPSQSYPPSQPYPPSMPYHPHQAYPPYVQQPVMGHHLYSEQKSVTHLPPQYINRNDYFPQQESPPTTTQKPTRKTRPPLHPAYLEWGDSRPSRPPPRPSPRHKIIASTEKPQTQEVPLSLTLMMKKLFKLKNARIVTQALRSKMSTKQVLDSEEDITRIDHNISASNQALNSNVFYGNRELGFRTSLPSSTSFDFTHH